MPIYEYQCPKCGRIFEDWVKSSESHKEKPCPKCGTLSPRIISRTSFVLKGDGWYVSDYGYRKGISEDGEKAPVPAKSTPVTPAARGEKSLAKTEDAPKKVSPKPAATEKPAKGAENKSAAAPKKESAKSGDGAKA